MASKLPATALLLAVLTGTTLAATCNYYRSSNRITCGSVTCSSQGNVQGGKLPAGTYRIGTYYSHGSTPWFNLYKAGRGFYWDYHTKIPETGCRGGFGLHPGQVSLGCITVTSNSCFSRLAAVINRYSSKRFSAKECRGCFWGICWRGSGYVSRTYATDLVAH